MGMPWISPDMMTAYFMHTDTPDGNARRDVPTSMPLKVTSRLAQVSRPSNGQLTVSQQSYTQSLQAGGSRVCGLEGAARSVHETVRDAEHRRASQQFETWFARVASAATFHNDLGEGHYTFTVEIV